MQRHIYRVIILIWRKIISFLPIHLHNPRNWVFICFLTVHFKNWISFVKTEKPKKVTFKLQVVTNPHTMCTVKAAEFCYIVHGGITRESCYNSDHTSNPFSPLFYPHRSEFLAPFHTMWPRTDNQNILKLR